MWSKAAGVQGSRGPCVRRCDRWTRASVAESPDVNVSDVVSLLPQLANNMVSADGLNDTDGRQSRWTKEWGVCMMM